MAHKLKPKHSGHSAQIAPIQEPVSTDGNRPVFSLRYIHKDFSLLSCVKDEKASFADTLFNLSQLTWRELILDHKHGLGCEKIPRYQIQSNPSAEIKDDVNFLAFRFYKKAPMVGYRDGDVFYIIWLDREFKLYEH
jgi:hypothetical protein